MKNYKILILSNYGFGEYRFRKELIECAVRTHQYQVYLSIPDNDLYDELTDIGAKVIITPFERRGMNPIADLRLIFQYRKVISEIRPNIVLTYTIKPNIYGGMVCRFKKIPYIMNVTGLGTAAGRKGILASILRMLYRSNIKNAKHVFFQNKENMESLMGLELGQTIANGTLIPGSGVNLIEHCFEEYPKNTEPIRFMFVGRIMKDKGIEEYLECAQVIHALYPKTVFDIIGVYDDERYKSIIEDLNSKNIIHYYGQRRDVHELMKDHHAIIQPSYHEGLSNVLLEAAACGRPVIATDVCGCRETYDDNITGIGFHARSSEALIEAVKKFLALPYEEKRKMGIAGRKKVERHFDRTTVVNKYMDEIEK